MKKIKHPMRTVLLTTLLAAMSAFGGCGLYKNFKKKPTPEERWARHLEIQKEEALRIIPSSATKTTNTIDRQRD